MASGWENTTLAARPRPLSELKGGKRLIPILVSANRIPILRTRKPQSPLLSMYVKAKMVQRQRRHDRRWELVEALKMAKLEDQWDRDVEKSLAEQEILNDKDEMGGGSETAGVTAKKKKSKVREPAWAREITSAIDDILNSLEREAEKNRLWTANMVDLIDKEKEMAEQERKDRKMAKNLERRERKKSRDLAEAGFEPGPEDTPSSLSHKA